MSEIKEKKEVFYVYNHVRSSRYWKGTIGNEICKKYNLEHVATGDIFRDEIKRQTELGKRQMNICQKENWIPDEVTIRMGKRKIRKSK